MSKATIKSLAEKRNELVRQIEEHQATIRQLNSDIDSIDAALRLFGAPVKTHETVYPRFRKELARMVFGMLRDAGSPMTAHSLAEKVLLARQISPDDAKLVKAIRARVRGCLQHYRDKGMVVSRENVHSQLEWSIA
jgi:hypothetical protein